MGDDDVFFKNRIEDMPNLNLVFRYSDAAMPSVSRDARAELAQLRADLQAAREIIGVAKNDYQSDVQDGVDSYDKCQRCIDWLAANPAPQEPQQAKNQDDDYRDYEAENEEMLWTYHHDPDHGL